MKPEKKKAGVETQELSENELDKAVGGGMFPNPFAGGSGSAQPIVFDPNSPDYCPSNIVTHEHEWEPPRNGYRRCKHCGKAESTT